MKNYPAIVQKQMVKILGDYDRFSNFPLVKQIFGKYLELEAGDSVAGAAFAKLSELMRPLAEDDAEIAADVICALCCEQEQMGFVVGLYAGLQLYEEMAKVEVPA